MGRQDPKNITSARVIWSRFDKRWDYRLAKHARLVVFVGWFVLFLCLLRYLSRFLMFRAVMPVFVILNDEEIANLLIVASYLYPLGPTYPADVVLRSCLELGWKADLRCITQPVQNTCCSGKSRNKDTNRKHRRPLSFNVLDSNDTGIGSMVGN